MAMAMFAIAVRPLVDRLTINQSIQVWFGDDATNGGKICGLRKWWDLQLKNGPLFGYFPNASKTWFW